MASEVVAKMIRLMLRFARDFARRFVVAHSQEFAVTKVSGFRPFNEADLADQLRFYPAAFLHSLGGEGVTPAGRAVLREIGEGAGGSLQFLELRKNSGANARHETVLHLRD